MHTLEGTGGSRPAEHDRTDRIDITQGGVRTAEASTITVTQGGISIATAEAIDLRQGGIGRATATDIAVSSGGVGLAQGGSVSLDRGLMGAAFGDQARVVQSMANIVGSRESTVDGSLVGTILASHVTIRRPSAIGILVAGRVEGTVRPLLDWRGAIVAGAIAGLTGVILRRR